MSDYFGYTPLVRSPVQAANTFSQFGGYPRQRNVFLIRFLVNGQGEGQTSGRNTTMQWLTFAAKSIDRPRVNPKVEEVNEYNKRRQVYTGYKLEPVRVQFYDSVDGAAQNMWTKYARYYFGDFNQGSEQGYHYTATQNEFMDNGKGFGFTGHNGGQADPNAQFFFRQIDLFHFYDNMFDQYCLINPRIDNFEPDDLSYDNSDISMITASFVYENLQYYPQQPVDPDAFSEFISGLFFGDPLIVPDAGFPFASADDFSGGFASNPLIGALLNTLVGSLGVSASYRYNSRRSTGALGLYGNFSFGSAYPVDLGTASYSNPALAAALSMGAIGNPLAAQTAMLYNAQAASRGIDPATYDYMRAQAMANSSGYGSVGQILTRGLLASAALGVVENAMMPRGVVYDPTVYGAINAQQTGTAQYGYNTQTTPDGISYGPEGPDGFTEPTGPLDNGPYNPYQPAGLYGRYGIIEEPLAPP